MTAVLHRPRAGVPFCRGGRYVVSRNDGHTDQDIWYVADSLAELRAGGRVLVDPNRLSADGRSSLQSLTISDSGRYAAIGVSAAGSDWQTYRLQDLSTGEDVPDTGDHHQVLLGGVAAGRTSLPISTSATPATTAPAPARWGWPVEVAPHRSADRA